MFAGYAIFVAARAGQRLRPDAPVASVVVGAIVGVHLVLAALFVRRRAALAEASTAGVLVSLPSLALGGAILAVAPPPGDWPLAAAVVFAAGVAVGVVSLVTLGRSFAVLPARRALVTRGPYRVVRHPAYAGELVAVCAAAAAAGADPVAWVVVVALVPALAARIRVEEQLLAGDPAWAAWAQRVRWRLVPGIW